jgi:glycosyltransferase involved in cell wall biosynthesis
VKRITFAAFRYAPAIGGAENYLRRLLQELGDQTEAEVLTVVTDQRTDWLKALIDGERDSPHRYEVDGRRVTALPRWPASTRRALWALAPAYHLPASPAPWRMGNVLAPQLGPQLTGAGVIHNVFMGREAFSAGLLIAARKAGVPFVFTPLRHQRPLGWSSPAFRKLYRESDAIVALTAGEAEWVIARGARPDRVRVIGLGPLNDRDASPAAAREHLRHEGPIVLFLGQLHNYKGFKAVLGAARLLSDRKDTLFVFAGPDVRDNSRAFARAGSNVRWLGSVPHQLRDSLLSACSVLCVPSARESFGSVVVEAWACGKPVVGGPASATRELIDDGVDGFVVPQDPHTLAERLTRLLDDAELAKTFGCRGQAKVEKKFSWRAIANSHQEIYARLTSERS